MTTSPTVPAVIRLAVSADLAGIRCISNWAAEHTAANFAVEPETPEQWSEDWAETHAMYPWVVADHDGRVIGFAKAGPHRGRCAYTWTAEVTVYVDSQYHGRGIGRLLYGALIPILRAQGYRTLLAGITLPNPASVRLHESFGFRRAGLFEKVGWKFGRFHDVSYWEAFLDDTSSPPRPVRPVSEVYHKLAPTEE
ncbi:MAG: GNAT family N-acetyltransferase [Planctomycetota bacterium]|jgi:phosphinothricin acetyltransferase